MWIQPLANRLLIDRVTGLGYVDLGSHTWNSERNGCDLWDMKFQVFFYSQLTKEFCLCTVDRAQQNSR
ncbi:hypothetical protein OUZ56_006264 [Daphnia magna]|uniref:Uncharacterized protein n=1 Tax=Daphnia magna TaxID=35525 RepID=A0ABQ9YV56_9CRUS|nr:hypothetical protein OUZ56_006264 [Daphnia magna]